MRFVTATWNRGVPTVLSTLLGSDLGRDKDRVRGWGQDFASEAQEFMFFNSIFGYKDVFYLIFIRCVLFHLY